jgi:long-chain acyl-CoA synthetase
MQKVDSSPKRLWFKSYPANVPHEINPDKYSSLSELFEQKVAQYAANTAYVNLGVEMTYQELEESSRHFANFLLQQLLLKKGDRVGIMTPNVLQFPIAFFGILRAGLIAVNINPLYTPAEIQPVIENSGLQTLLVLSPFAHVIESLLPTTPIKNIIISDPMDLFPPVKRAMSSFYFKILRNRIPTYNIPHALNFRDALAFGKTILFKPIASSANDIALLQYTGGTTGTPKGAILTHRNLLANIEQSVAWVSPVLSENSEIFITALPLYHIFSLMANLLVPLFFGARNILITNPRNTKRFIEEIAKTNFTVITGVNTLFSSLIQNADFCRHVNFHSLKLCLSGGMALQQNLAEKWKKITGSILLEAYGLSETSPGISMMPITTTKNKASVGLPWPSTDIEIRNEQGNPLPINTVGEIWVKGPQVMQGYWRNEVSTASVLVSGWFNTEDLGKMDENGFISIVDRKKDMIIISGFNVYPVEIEHVIEQHPDVKEVAVIGIKDKNGQEIIKACIIPLTLTLSRQAIINHCKQYLTPYKIPKIIEFFDDLPRSNVGKILKRTLR